MSDAVDRRFRLALLILSGVGIAVATYLVYIHYAGIKPICAVSGGCELVQKSKWSEFLGIPVADIGLAGYIGIFASLLIFKGELNRLVPMGLILVGFAFTCYLKYAEFFLVKAVCIWCVASALIMLALAIVSVWRYVRAPVAVTPSSGSGDEVVAEA
jgi:uncharacterized membrane protein